MYTGIYAEISAFRNVFKYITAVRPEPLKTVHHTDIIRHTKESNRDECIPEYIAKVNFLGLGPGSPSQCNMYWLRQMPVYWT